MDCYGEFSKNNLNTNNVFHFLYEAEHYKGRVFQKDSCIKFIVNHYSTSSVDFNRKVIEFLTPDCVIEILLASAKYKNQLLKIACDNFINYNKFSVIKSEGWINLLKINKELAAELGLTQIFM